MARAEPDTDQLVGDASRGDAGARQLLLTRHRDRLRRMIAVRLDRRLAARVDPSDVVQEALAEAARRLDGYLRGPPLPFYPWLRHIAWERLVKVHRHHLYARRRTVEREEPPGLPDESAVELAERLLASHSGPSARLRRREQRDRVLAALEALPDQDRDVLVLRYLEDLPTAEAAAVLGVSDGAVKMRLLRAVQRLRDVLGEEDLP
jgi:RNA polymerase sigma-70 factor (ECF subfamily)